MKIIIPEQEYFFRSEDAEKILAVLRAFGIDFSKENVSSETTLGSLGFTLRAQNILFRKFNARQLNWRQATIKDLVNKFSRTSLLKTRGCGRKTIEEIEDVVSTLGYQLKD